MFPSYFIGHGAPTIIFDENSYTDTIRNLAKRLPTPKGIILFSAHFESPIQLISTVSNYSMIYDFYGFPEEMYTIQYPAKGDPELARRIQQEMSSHGIKSELESKRGLDHGAWTVLAMMYPAADIPVVSMSVNPFISAAEYFKIGASLCKFKEEGYLIITSGGIVHNLRMVRFQDDGKVDPWALDFDNWITDRLIEDNLTSLGDYAKAAPSANLAVPRPEHFVNLLLAAGTRNEGAKATLLATMIQFGNLSLDVWEFE